MNTARGVRTVAVLLMLAGCSSGGGGSAGKGGSGAEPADAGARQAPRAEQRAAGPAAPRGPSAAAGGGSTGVAGAGGGGGTTGVAGHGWDNRRRGRRSGRPASQPANSSIAAGFRHTCAIKSDGTLACWGYNSSAQLGSGNRNSYWTPNTVAGLAGVTAIATGANETCAIHSGGNLSCWGNTSNTLPVAVAGFTGVKAVAVRRHAQVFHRRRRHRVVLGQ